MIVKIPYTELAIFSIRPAGVMNRNVTAKATLIFYSQRVTYKKRDVPSTGNSV